MENVHLQNMRGNLNANVYLDILEMAITAEKKHQILQSVSLECAYVLWDTFIMELVAEKILYQNLSILELNLCAMAIHVHVQKVTNSTYWPKYVILIIYQFLLRVSDLVVNFPIIILSYLIIFYEDVHCDLHDGSQCGLDAKCIYEPQYDHSTCQCNKGFVGDGFECEKFHQTIDKSDCTRHSQCVNDEKCVVVSSNLSDFFYKCLVPEYHQEPEPMEPEEVPDEPQPNPDLCRSNNDCHQNADCKYDQGEQRQICKCKEFYVGDGINNCSPGPGKIW